MNQEPNPYADYYASVPYVEYARGQAGPESTLNCLSLDCLLAIPRQTLIVGPPEGDFAHQRQELLRSLSH